MGNCVELDLGCLKVSVTSIFILALNLLCIRRDVSLQSGEQRETGQFPQTHLCKPKPLCTGTAEMINCLSSFAARAVNLNRVATEVILGTVSSSVGKASFH
uniref:Uncharacterized protein n=1 Tax=Mus musculus TaxID=10090 RepID=Q8C980_MOUSE|nr:unnamed protein product [Mus musculus]